MPRARNIKPGFFVNEKLAEIGMAGRLLFIGLWTLADREGRLEDRPKKIKAQVLPYDDCDVDELLNQLNEKGFIIRYEVDGYSYIEILKFKKHQNPHIREAASEIPPPPVNEKAGTGSNNAEMKQAPDKHHASTVQAPDKHQKSPADSLLLNPDSCTRSTDSPKPEYVAGTGHEIVLKNYSENISPVPSPLEAERIMSYLDQLEPDLVCYAIEEAVRQNVRRLAYVEKILQRFLQEGVKTREQAENLKAFRTKAGNGQREPPVSESKLLPRTPEEKERIRHLDEEIAKLSKGMSLP